MIPLLPRRSDWQWLWIRTLLATAVLLAFIVALACSSGNSPPGTSPVPEPCVADCAPPPPPACPSTGLAAVDLAGQCRAMPQATMGALEAVP